MPFPIPRGPGLARLAQAAQQSAAGGAVPPQPKRNPEPAGNIPKRIQETINPVDLPGGVGQVGPPQPISPPFPGGQSSQQPLPIPPQMPPGMQFPIQDPTPAPPPIGQPAPIPPLNLGPPQMPMPPRPPQAPPGPGIDPNMFGPPPPPPGGVPFDAELEAAQQRMQQTNDEERARQRRNTPITLHGPGNSSRNPGR